MSSELRRAAVPADPQPAQLQPAQLRPGPAAETARSSTEMRNDRTTDIDTVGTLELLRLLNA